MRLGLHDRLDRNQLVEEEDPYLVSGIESDCQLEVGLGAGPSEPVAFMRHVVD